MTRRRGQDEFTRHARMKEGSCPTHGISLHMDVPYHGDNDVVTARFYCPRGDCGFERTINEDHRLWKAFTSP